MSKTRPKTPEPIARQLRQEASFGCCKCGHPIFEYHHIVPYASEPHFRAEDMMILCPNCHDETIKGVMREQEQRYFKAHPYNVNNGYSKGWLVSKSGIISVRMGSNVFTGQGGKVQVNGETLISLSTNGQGCLEITSALYDEQDQLVFSIHNNEWLSGDPSPWDIEASYQVLTIRERLSHILFSLDLRKEPAELRAEFWRSGFQIKLSPSEMLINQNSYATIQDSLFENCGVAIEIGNRVRVRVGARI